MKIESTLTAALLAGMVAYSSGADVIVAENFSGTGIALDATTADTFEAAITTAGGSNAGRRAASF